MGSLRASCFGAIKGRMKTRASFYCAYAVLAQRFSAKMKNVTKFAVSIFSLLTVLFAACSDIETDAFVFYSESELVERGLRQFTFDVSSKSALLKVSSATDSQRTITPAAYNSSELKFYLGGKNVGSGETLAVQEVAFVPNENSSSSGTITVPLNSYNYQLTLIAIPAATEITLTSSTYISGIVQYAVLAGSTTADLRYNNDSAVDFYLSSNGLSGAGNFDIDFYLSNWSEASIAIRNPGKSGSPAVVNDVKIALYTLSGSLVSGTSTTQALASCTSQATAFSYEGSSIKAGTYELCVEFSYNDKTFVYSDQIIILPYQTTSAVIGIPDILQVVPTAPTDLRQSYMLPDNDNTDFYKVIFEWEDNSNTETGFELQLLDTAEFGISASFENDEDSWSSVSSTYITSYSTDFYGSSEWYAGSLERNSTFAVFYVPLGGRYLARIRAVNNDIGGSEWCYASSDSVSVTLPSGTATAESASLSYDKKVTGTAFPDGRINLYRLKYNLVGGSISPSSLNTVQYVCQTAAGTEILSPDGSLVIVQNGDSLWKAWAISSIDGETYPLSYTRCTSADQYNASTTYYGRVSRTDERVSALNLSATDINGDTDTYIEYETQPTQAQFSNSNGWQNYWLCDDVLKNYLGYQNLSLYALYEDDDGTSEGKDYSIKSNINISISVGSEEMTLENRSFTVTQRSSSTLYVNYDYKSGAALSASNPYTSVTLIVSEEGGSEIGSYTATARQVSIPMTTFSSGKDYMLTIKAVKNGSTYSQTVFMSVE